MNGYELADEAFGMMTGVESSGRARAICVAGGRRLPKNAKCPLQVLLADGTHYRVPAALGGHEDEHLTEGPAAPAEDAGANEIHPSQRVSHRLGC